MRESQEEMNQLLINIALALACVFFVMASLFESLLHPFVIMLCIPFAILGVQWMCMLTGTPLNIMALIGVVILIGIVVNNGIILIDHINSHRRAGRNRDEAVLLGGYYFPMARAIMGGLAASTALTLLVLPTFYVIAERTLLWVRWIGWRARNRFEGQAA